MAHTVSHEWRVWLVGNHMTHYETIIQFYMMITIKRIGFYDSFIDLFFHIFSPIFSSHPSAPWRPPLWKHTAATTSQLSGWQWQQKHNGGSRTSSLLIIPCKNKPKKKNAPRSQTDGRFKRAQSKPSFPAAQMKRRGSRRESVFVIGLNVQQAPPIDLPPRCDATAKQRPNEP